ncbi:hypothetical protein D3C81_1975800 [compost metagenome]
MVPVHISHFRVRRSLVSVVIGAVPGKAMRSMICAASRVGYSAGLRNAFGK